MAGVLVPVPKALAPEGLPLAGVPGRLGGGPESVAGAAAQGWPRR